MALLSENDLKKNLSGKNLSSVYLLFGDDAYLKKHYLEKISKQTAEKDDVFNYFEFFDKCSLQDVYDAAMQLPFMCDKKCVILNDYDFEHCQKDDFDRLIELIAEIPDTCVFIIYFDAIEIDRKKGAKFKKIVSAVEKSGGLAVALDHRSRAELVKMLCDGAKKRGCVFERDAAEKLIETAGNDINLLKGELEKLCAFSGSKPINKDTVDKVCVKTVEADIYRLSIFVMSGNTGDALKILDELMFMRYEPMIILYTLANVYIDMYRVYSAKGQGLKITDVANAFNYKNKVFLLERAERNLRKYDFEKLKCCLSYITKADGAIKSFASDARIVLEELIVKLSGI